MAMTLRLPEALKGEAQAHAATLSLSINALVALALREYLDVRLGTARSAPRSAAPTPLPGTPAGAPLLLRPGAARHKAPASRNDPCPCGAMNTQGYPIKWKRCHGAVKPA